MAGPLDELGTSAGTIAGWVAAAGLAALSVWKAVMRLRSDSRHDRAEERTHRAADYVDVTYKGIIDSLKHRLDGLDNAVEEMDIDLKRERAARLEAEDRAVLCERDRIAWEHTRKTMLEGLADCERHSSELSSRVNELGAKVAELERVKWR